MQTDYTEVVAPKLRVPMIEAIVEHNRRVASTVKAMGMVAAPEYRFVSAECFGGGWGYAQDDACVVSCVGGSGVSLEHLFATRRVWEEVIHHEPPEALRDFHCIRAKCLCQALTHDAKGRSFDRLDYLVTGFREADLEFLKRDMWAHRGYKNDPDGLKRHEMMAAQRRIGYKTTYWFDITSFFGRQGGEIG